ncbi:hypothetical protein BDV25DRAFT_135176 [Aspergillus avenaceus]|uniref:Glycosyl transferase CAP10 domain-containing protein n=1 Tax=Aspergillus avenaceus TaxID=36643 RepID=A0A5N6U952_ASPAV|nr:hypothetical protein BDV25DRAFT_135176 [Aspergillus avenaceus]
MVHNVDDFQQIIDDLRPFWATEPWLLRQMAASLCERGDGIGGIHIRDKTVTKLSHPSWRIEALAAVISRFVNYLPDMGIAVNTLDQPRLVVPFDEIQRRLEVEQNLRHTYNMTEDSFTDSMDHLLNLTQSQGGWDKQTDPQWFSPPRQRLMEVAKMACPPETPARAREMTIEDADKLYKTPVGGFVRNFNLSTDLCTIGPTIEELHSLLIAPVSLSISQRLLPVFGECKEDTLLWRGVTSGGISRLGGWTRLHRQRLILLTNGTADHNETILILSEGAQNVYEPADYGPSDFAQDRFDVGFTEIRACEPDCSMYDSMVSVKPPVPLGEQFKVKYLVDIDGHGFSGRWRAFLFSRSLGLKATIFREWHDSRLIPWRHFVPLDNRHDFVANKIASQGRSWASQVLRDEDMDIYVFLLLLEYGRIIDDNRDHIGYGGDGGELDDFDKSFVTRDESISSPS